MSGMLSQFSNWLSGACSRKFTERERERKTQTNSRKWICITVFQTPSYFFLLHVCQTLSLTLPLSN